MNWKWNWQLTIYELGLKDEKVFGFDANILPKYYKPFPDAYYPNTNWNFIQNGNIVQLALSQS